VRQRMGRRQDVNKVLVRLSGVTRKFGNVLSFVQAARGIDSPSLRACFPSAPFVCSFWRSALRSVRVNFHSKGVATLS